jgi:hypothetical protein
LTGGRGLLEGGRLDVDRVRDHKTRRGNRARDPAPTSASYTDDVSRRLITLGAITLTGLLALAFSAPALAKQRDRLELTAPATNTAGEAFVIRISGFVVAPANTFTYYISQAGCPAAFHTANSVGTLPL